MAARIHRAIRARRVGETIAFLPFASAGPADAIRTWMGSAQHRAALLSPDFRRIGVGRGSGSFGGGGFVVTVDLAG
jgi:uncharacterized protein YkwD